MTPGAKSWGYGYAAYGLAAVLVLLYVFFPSEALRTHIARRVNAALPGLTVTIGEIRPSLPAAVMLKSVDIRHGDTPVLTIERLRIAPRVQSWLRDAGRYALSGSAGGGEISGEARSEPDGAASLAGLSLRLEGAQMEKIAGLQGVYGSRLSGRLTVELNSKEPGGLAGRLTATEAQVELAQPIFDQKTLTFRTVDAELSLQNRSLTLRSGRLRGDELDADIAGTIALDPATAPNALRLNGRLVPHREFIARMEGKLPPNFLRRRGGLSFRLTGSLAEPGFSLN
jgi:type II secretion system protein N